MQKGFSVILVLVGLVAVVVVAGGIFYVARLTAPKPQPESSVSKLESSPISTSKPSNVNSQTSTDSSMIVGWKTHTNSEGNYSVQYPSDWVLEIFKEKYPYNARYDKAHIVFQTRETTSKEKADDAPGLPVDMATGSIKIINTDSMRGTDYSKISEQDFFNPNNAFWPKGDAGGGGPGTTYSVPEEVKVAGKRTIKQTSHPTTAYEWVGPNQISTNYYVWLGNQAHEVVEITFTYDDKNPNKSSLIKAFDKMLSTFKLTQ